FLHVTIGRIVFGSHAFDGDRPSDDSCKIGTCQAHTPVPRRRIAFKRPLLEFSIVGLAFYCNDDVRVDPIDLCEGTCNGYPPGHSKTDDTEWCAHKGGIPAQSAPVTTIVRAQYFDIAFHSSRRVSTGSTAAARRAGT